MSQWLFISILVLPPLGQHIVFCFLLRKLCSIEEIKKEPHKYFCVTFPGEAPVNTHFCGNTCGDHDCSGRIVSSRTSVVKELVSLWLSWVWGGTPLWKMSPVQPWNENFKVELPFFYYLIFLFFSTVIVQKQFLNIWCYQCFWLKFVNTCKTQKGSQVNKLWKMAH